MSATPKRGRARRSRRDASTSTRSRDLRTTRTRWTQPRLAASFSRNRAFPHACLPSVSPSPRASYPRQRRVGAFLSAPIPGSLPRCPPVPRRHRSRRRAAPARADVPPRPKERTAPGPRDRVPRNAAALGRIRITGRRSLFARAATAPATFRSTRFCFQICAITKESSLSS
jgi:hypothetical protein